MSKTYIVQENDSFESISLKEYGNKNLSSDLFKANQILVNGNDKLVPGQVIIIPDISTFDKLKESQETNNLRLAQNEMTISIDDNRLFFTDATIVRTMDTVADGFSISMQWQPFPGPFKYNQIKIYLGNILKLNGVVYQVGASISNSQRTKTLEGGSKTIDLIDSTLNADDYEQNNVSLIDRCNRLVNPKGIKVINETDAASNIFKRVTAGPTDTIFSHLSSLAKQRGVILSSNESGDLLILNANINGAPVATLREETTTNNVSINYNGRARFNVYKIIGQSPGSNINYAIETDSIIPRSRFKCFTASDNLGGEMKQAAIWQKNKGIGRSFNLQWPLTGWYDPNNKLWEVNTIVTVISETLHINNGKNFLINKVEFKLNASGASTILSLIDPITYSNEQ